ncbi:MAG: tetratricopeptide repeat protein [Acidobacteriaceae bacterium]|nr:tetratricopeptide repeat protein [Acidobacteriaceae bacterium]
MTNMMRLLLAGSLLCAAYAQTSDPLDLVKQGRKLNNEGKQDEAIALYKQAIARDPNLAEAYLAAGVAFDLKGDYAQAQHHISKAIELAKPEAKAQAQRTMAMSLAFERKGSEAAKYEKPIFDAQLADKKFGAAAETADELARIFIESGDLDNAYKWYQTGHETALKQPNLSDAEKDLWAFRWEHAQARIAARRGKPEDAKMHVEAALAVIAKNTNPDQQRFVPYLTGYVAFYTGDNKTAITELQKADQRDPFILSLLAQAYEKAGENEKAMELYRKIMNSNIHNPTNAFARPLARKKLSS